ncbi:hypothetical protein J437_LFUL001398 [Ladona fulva]|uniref:PiggyBac transposable element-derived protein domain-containing protein n=1 Tax=Ladona fulva TaxID=123851 RepID=A0A8K0JZ37_LADFU|nr:hypothetical protein J437_LFUL001398 [Ladona fulva]
MKVISRFRGNNTKLIKFKAYEDDECDVETITINPPLEDTNMATDEDSDASDLVISGNPRHLPRRILQAKGSMIKSNIEKSTSPVRTDSAPSVSTTRRLRKRKDVLNIEELPSKVEDIYAFLGVLLLSGYHQLPNRRLYWSKSEDCSVEIVSNSIRRNRFEEILRYLHLADNARYDGQDRLYKVRPLFSVLNKNLKILFQSENISVDESIIPYYGRHGFKQFIRGKPIRLDSAGYLYHAEPYAGVDTDLHKTDLGQGGDVVLGFVDTCRVPPGMKTKNLLNKTYQKRNRCKGYSP